jgi:hypothetical protein
MDRSIFERISKYRNIESTEFSENNYTMIGYKKIS